MATLTCLTATRISRPLRPTGKMSSPATPTFVSRLSNAFDRRYLIGLWLPFVATVAAIFAAVLPYPWSLEWLSTMFASLYVSGLALLLALCITRFCKKRFALALATFGALGFAVAALAPALVTGFSLGVFGSPDRFTDNLTIPSASTSGSTPSSPTSATRKTPDPSSLSKTSSTVP